MEDPVILIYIEKEILGESRPFCIHLPDRKTSARIEIRFLKEPPVGSFRNTELHSFTKGSVAFGFGGKND